MTRAAALKDGTVYFTAYGLPAPLVEYRFCPPRRWRFDFAWPVQWLALEIEGGVWTKGRHVRGAGFVGDMAKYNEATVMGWRILRVTPEELRKGAAAQLVKRVQTMRIFTSDRTSARLR